MTSNIVEFSALMCVLFVSLVCLCLTCLCCVVFICFVIIVTVALFQWSFFVLFCIKKSKKSSKGKGTENLLEPLLDTSLLEFGLDDLKVLEEIGFGTSGAVVYKALWKHETVAFKLYKSTFFSDNNGTKEFEWELSLMSSLKHSNLVACYGASLHPPRVGIITEFCSGGDLTGVIQKFSRRISRNEKTNKESQTQNIDEDYFMYENPKFPFSKKILMLLYVARGMRFLHSKNVIHRDLKCDNVLIDASGIAKISDFGLCTIKDHERGRMTMAVGTALFMAPEVFLGKSYDEKCDIFSFAIVAYEILFETTNPYECFLNTDSSSSNSLGWKAGSDRGSSTIYGLEAKVASDPTFRPRFPPKDKMPKDHLFLMEVIEKSWAANPEERPTFNDIVSILEKEMDTLSGANVLVNKKESQEENGPVILEESEESRKNQ